MFKSEVNGAHSNSFTRARVEKSNDSDEHKVTALCSVWSINSSSLFSPWSNWLPALSISATAGRHDEVTLRAKLCTPSCAADHVKFFKTPKWRGQYFTYSADFIMFKGSWDKYKYSPLKWMYIYSTLSAWVKGFLPSYIPLLSFCSFAVEKECRVNYKIFLSSNVYNTLV